MLENLKDIHLSPPISWWPLAIGWWFLPLLIFILCLALWRIFKRPRLKKQALRLLKKIEQEFEVSQDSSKCLRELSVLLRRVAMSQTSACAGLIGPAWLEFLNQKLETPEFSADIGHLLLNGPYQPSVKSSQVPKLIKLCRKWMEAK